MSACWPSVAETCVFEISLRSIGSAPIRSCSARSWVSWIVADARDLRAGVAVDALRVLAEVDRRERDDLVVERDREALERRVLRSPRGQHLLGAALREALRHALERAAALVGELHRHDRLLRALVGVRLRVFDVRAGELGVVLEHEVARLGVLVLRLLLLVGLHDHDPARDHRAPGSRSGGPAAPSFSSSSRQALFAGTFGFGPRFGEARLALEPVAVIGEQLLAARRGRDVLPVGQLAGFWFRPKR